MHPPPELETLRDWLRWAVTRFGDARLAFGHGTTNAYDEAAYLLLHALHLPIDRLRKGSASPRFSRAASTSACRRRT